MSAVRGLVILLSLASGTAAAQVPDTPCDNFLLAPRQVKGKAVGPKSCLMQETSATYEGRALTRIDVGLDGTVDGYLAKVGNYKEYFSNSPDLVFPQTWGPREILFGVAAYERAKGASMTIVFPRDRAAWNGKTWVAAPGLNVGRDGKRFFDGILADDPAAGTWYPVVMKDGKDVLFGTDAEKAAFVPEIDVAHQMYNNIWEPKHPAWMSDSYLENKRNNARILRDKGIAKYRMYEVRGVSHAGGESEGWRGQLLNLDLAKVMDRFIDMIDAWADRGVAPPPTHSDWAQLGGASRDGTIEYPALAFPELACPLG